MRSRARSSYQVEPELDGSSLKMVCVEGVLDRAVTQGNVIGSDIFSLTAVLGAVVNERISIALGLLGRGLLATLVLSAPVWRMAWPALQVRPWQGFFLPVLHVLFWLRPGGNR